MFGDFSFLALASLPVALFVSVFLSAVAVLRHLCALTSVFSRRTPSRPERPRPTQARRVVAGGFTSPLFLFFFLFLCTRSLPTSCSPTTPLLPHAPPPLRR